MSSKQERRAHIELTIDEQSDKLSQLYEDLEASTSDDNAEIESDIRSCESWLDDLAIDLVELDTEVDED